MTTRKDKEKLIIAVQDNIEKFSDKERYCKLMVKGYEDAGLAPMLWMSYYRNYLLTGKMPPELIKINIAYEIAKNFECEADGEPKEEVQPDRVDA